MVTRSYAISGKVPATFVLRNFGGRRKCDLRRPVTSGVVICVRL